MKKMCRVMKSQAGETIAEVLIALLISTLALTMLAAMISSSSSMIQKSSHILEEYYENSPRTSSDGSVTITFNSKKYKYENVKKDERDLSGKTITGYHID